MFGTFVLGVIAGFAAPQIERPLRRVIENALMAEDTLGAAELRGLALAVSLLIAALLSAILAGGGAVALTLGGVIGLFGPRIVAMIQNR